MSLLDNAVADPALGLLVAQAVRALYGNDPQLTIDAMLRAQQPGLPWVSTFIPGAVDHPTMYWGYNQLHGFFVAGGTENVNQGLRLLDGYSYWIPIGLPPINQYLAQLANAFVDSGSYQLFQATPTIHFTGHSLGGALATLLAWRQRNGGPNTRTQVITLGSPRSGAQQFATDMRFADVARWMNDTDPVPLVPPTFAQAPVALLGYNVLQLANWAGFVHTAGGISMDEQGNPTPAILPPNAEVNPTTSLASWLLSLENLATSSHPVIEYEARFRRRLAAVPLNPNANGVIAPLELADPLNRRELRREEGATVQTIFRNGEQQQQGPVIIPPALPFYKVKFRGVWCVGFGAYIVAIGPTRRRAGAMANAGNSFIRKMLRQALVDPVTLTSQWESFMAVAADPTSEVRPTLRITV